MLKKDLPPASFVYTGDILEQTVIKTTYYNAESVYTDEVPEHPENYTKFIKINGFSDHEKITEILTSRNVDSLLIEDVFNVSQRSKIEIVNDAIFVVMKSVTYVDGEAVHDYVSLISVGDTVISINAKQSHLFTGVLLRIANSSGIIRTKKSAYLLYALMDTIIDKNMTAVKEIEDKLSLIEDLALDDQLIEVNSVYTHRKELNYLRNSVSAFFDLSSKQLLVSHNSMTPDIIKYYYDVFDHVYKLGEQINNGKESLRIIYEIQMNNTSLNMNKIMQTLTIFSAIFIPLSFLAGVFGMNFVEMPLLSFTGGFLVFVALCLMTTIGMLIFFKKRDFY